MKLEELKLDFTVCKINDLSFVDFAKEFVFLSKTDDEISLVCESDSVPKEVIVRDDGWRALKIKGILDFEMVGVIAKISKILATAKISIFVISTFNTDYILIKSTYLEKSVELLKNNGYLVA